MIYEFYINCKIKTNGPLFSSKIYLFETEINVSSIVVLFSHRLYNYFVLFVIFDDKRNQELKSGTRGVFSLVVIVYRRPRSGSDFVL